MKFIKSKKGLALLATLAVAVVAAVGAYAYFTSTGHGIGSATVGTSSDWVVGQTATSGPDLLPDDTIGTGNVQAKTYTVNNPSAGHQNLTHVDVSVADTALDGSPAAWSKQDDPSKPACTASDFSVGGAAVGTTYTDIDSSGNFAPAETRTDSVTVQMIDNGLNQDNCKGVTVPLYFAAS